MIVSLLLHFTVLMTFGIACPMLGVAIIATIVIQSHLYRLLIGRYVALVDNVAYPEPGVNPDDKLTLVVQSMTALKYSTSIAGKASLLASCPW